MLKTTSKVAMKSYITSITITTDIVMKGRDKLAYLLVMDGIYQVFKPCLIPHIKTSTKMKTT